MMWLFGMRPAASAWQRDYSWMMMLMMLRRRRGMNRRHRYRDLELGAEVEWR